MDFHQKYVSHRKLYSKILSADLKSFQKFSQATKPHVKIRLNLLSPKRICNDKINDNKSKSRNNNIKLIQNLNSLQKLLFEKTTKNSQLVKKLKTMNEENEELSLDIKKVNKNFDQNNKILFPLISSYEFPNKKIKKIKSSDNLYNENLLLVNDKNFENYFLKNSEKMNRNLKSLHLLDIMQIEILPGQGNLKEVRKAISEENNSIEKSFKHLKQIYPIKLDKKLNLNDFYNMSNLQKIENYQKDIEKTKTTLSSMEELNEFAFLPSSNVNSRVTSGTYATSERINSPLVNRSYSNYNLCTNNKTKNDKVSKRSVDLKLLPPFPHKKLTFFVNNSQNYNMYMEKLKNINLYLNQRMSFGFRQKNNKLVELENLYDTVSKAKDCLDYSEDINNYYTNKNIPIFKLKKEIKRMDLLIDKVQNLGKKLRNFEILEKNCDIREDKLKKKHIQDLNEKIKIQIFDLENNVMRIATKMNTKI